MSQLVQPGDFCPNRDCADYEKPQTAAQRNIIKFGRARNGQQRCQCRTCQHTFTATKGTLFYRRQTPASEIIKALAQLAAGNRITRSQLDGLWAHVGNKGGKRTTQKPRRPASSGVPSCWTSTPGLASRKPKPKPRKKSSKRRRRADIPMWTVKELLTTIAFPNT